MDWFSRILPLLILPVATLYLHFGNQENKFDAMLNLFMTSFPVLPHYMEAGYSPLGRSPAVDAFLGDPLYLGHYANQLSVKIRNEPSLAKTTSYLLLASGIPLEKGASDSSIYEPPAVFLETFSREAAELIYSAWRKFLDIRKKTQKILSVLSEEEKRWILENRDRFFFGEEASSDDYDFFTTESTFPFKFYSLASKLDLSSLSDCLLSLSEIADALEFSKKILIQGLNKDKFIWQEDGAILEISSASGVEHKEMRDFFIDLGGSNKITSNAGGTLGILPVALHLDFKGNNSYEGKQFVQGSGCLGIGMLAAYGNPNRYLAESYSQGCGFFGLGVLRNSQGANQFNIDFGGQSFALFGFSLIDNLSGNNSYVATQGMAQSASSTLGASFLIERQGGNSMSCGQSGKGGKRFGGIGQGGSSGVRGYPWLNRPSLYGGLAFLLLGDGGNHLKTAWLGQGSAYFLGAGILVAEGENDLFEADFDAQGQGLHLAAGLLLHKGGHSHFKGGWGSIAVGGDRAIGMLINLGSHNVYEGTEQSIGTSRKPKAMGLFIGLGGQNSYNFNTLSCARIQYPQYPNEWSKALFVQFAGGNNYTQNIDDQERGDGKIWGIQPHSMGSSETFPMLQPEELFEFFPNQPRLPFSFDPHSGWKENSFFRPLPTLERDPTALIKEGKYDTRRQIYERLDLNRFTDRSHDPDLSALFQDPAALPDDALSYAILWGLRHKSQYELEPLKKALTLETIGSSINRKMALSLLSISWDPSMAALFKQLMTQDPSDEVRYTAALALTQNGSEEILPFLAEGSKSPLEVVRFAIAKGLQESSIPNALTIVIPLFNDSSVYVRRAAGLTALSLGDKRGVPVILETLSFSSLDTDENYGDNIYAQLKKYLEVDFGRDPDAWKNWWAEQKS